MKQTESHKLNLADFRATDREECGILVGKIIDGHRVPEYIVATKNVAVGQEDDYEITMKEFHRVEKSLIPGEIIVGFFHTHLPHHDIDPSENDLEGASVFPVFMNLVYKPDTGEHAWYSAP